MENVIYKILDNLNFSFKNLSEMSSKSGPVPTDKTVKSQTRTIHEYEN